MKEDILDNYVLNRLSAKDKVWLEKALAKNPDFQNELDFHADIIKGLEVHMEGLFDQALQEAQAFADEKILNTIREVDAELEQEGFFAIPVKKDKNKEKTLDKGSISLDSELVENIKVLGQEELQSTIKEVDKELEQEGFFEQQAISKQETTKEESDKKPVTSGVSIISMFKMVVAAASIVLVLTLGWQYGFNNNKSVDAGKILAFEHYDNTLSKAVEMELSESGFAGNPKEAPLKQLQEALTAYDNKNYNESSKLLTVVIQKGVDAEYEDKALLYLALSHVGNKENAKAIPYLKQLIESNSSQKETAAWYLAAVHYTDNNIGLAKKQLETLKSSAVYGERATKLLESL